MALFFPAHTLGYSAFWLFGVYFNIIPTFCKPTAVYEFTFRQLIDKLYLLRHYGGMSRTVLSHHSKQLFSCHARTYDAYSGVQGTVFDRLKSMLPSTAHRILDIGCGTGARTRQLVDRFPDAHITAIDYAPAMIELAQRCQPHPQITYRVQDVDTVDVTSPFDLIVSNATFQWLPQPTDTLARLAQSLTPNGILVYSAFGPRTFYQLSDLLADVIGGPVALPAHHFLTHQNWDQLLNLTFDHHHTQSEEIELTYESVVQLLQAIKFSGTQGQISHQIPWSPGLVKKLEQAFLLGYEKVIVSYEAIYGSASSTQLDALR